MSFDDLEQEFNQYYSMFLNEPVQKVSNHLRIIITTLLQLMQKAWEDECYNA